MTIIKLSAIDSTNTFLKQIASAEKLKDYTCVITESQTSGKGQMGSTWNSESSKNLTFSLFKSIEDLKVENHFFLSIITSLAIIKTLKSFDIPKLHIKWPNDILSEKKKLCGILIETNTRHYNIQSAIIGVGLNVNQTVFYNLPKASSLKLITGKTYNLDNILTTFLTHIKYYFTILENKNYKILYNAYYEYLYRKGKPSTFKNCSSGELFIGFITGITNHGHLILTLENAVEKSFDLKEIELLY